MASVGTPAARLPDTETWRQALLAAPDARGLFQRAAMQASDKGEVNARYLEAVVEEAHRALDPLDLAPRRVVVLALGLGRHDDGVLAVGESDPVAEGVA